MKNKVLIIEDEILARVGLHQLLDWEALGFILLEDAKAVSYTHLDVYKRQVLKGDKSCFKSVRTSIRFFQFATDFT